MKEEAVTNQSTSFVASIKAAAASTDDPLRSIGVWAFAIAQVAAVVVERAVAVGAPNLHATQTFVAVDSILDYLADAGVAIAALDELPTAPEDIDATLPELITGIRAAVTAPNVPAWPFTFLAPAHAA